MKKDILQVLKDLLKHRTEDAGSYEFVLESWIEEAAAEIERLRTLATHTTPSEDSVQGEFTDTVFKTLVERISLTQSLLDENERLRRAIRLLADQDATLSVQGGNVTVTLDATLTDAEREAIEIAAAELDDEYYGTNCKKELAAAATLRKLLERLR